MVTTIHKWFLLAGLDDTATDVELVATQTATGEDYISLAENHLTLLTGGSTITPDMRSTMVAQMAAELYIKSGRLGVPQSTTLGDQVTLLQNYTPLMQDLIGSQKRIRTLQ